jgi:DNA-binding CsgD family transcriptional regulator
VLSPEALALFYRLTSREADVAILIARGLSPAGVAEQLGVSRNSVKFHLRNIFEKTGVGRQAELVELLLSAALLLG